MRELWAEADINSRLVSHFREIGHTLRAVSEGKGSQKRILIVIDHFGSITQSALTEHLGIQTGSASEVLGKLEAAGLITRAQSDSDKRTTDVRLTLAGREAAKEAAAQRAARNAKMFSCLSEAEKEALLVLLERVNDAWDELYRQENAEER